MSDMNCIVRIERVLREVLERFFRQTDQCEPKVVKQFWPLRT
jgi:hypothetical protein